MLDYRLEELKQRQKNITDLRNKLQNGKIDKKLLEKISKFAEKFGYEKELIIYKLIHDDLFLLFFIKDPAKQGFHQNLGANFIENIPNVFDFEVLPANNEKSLYVSGGTLLTYTQMKSSSALIKSIDFQWKYKNIAGQEIQCYASHKYTFEAGGAQDNQFKDISIFLEHAQKHRGNLYFYAICDGDYYKPPFGNYLSKIDYLNNHYSGPRCYALDVNQLEDHMLKNL